MHYKTNINSKLIYLLEEAVFGKRPLQEFLQKVLIEKMELRQIHVVLATNVVKLIGVDF